MKRFCCLLLCLAIILSVLTIFVCARKEKDDEDLTHHWERLEKQRSGERVIMAIGLLIAVGLDNFMRRYRNPKVVKESKTKLTQWHCCCGRDNPSYTHTCVCGRQKREVLLSENKEENGQ